MKPSDPARRLRRMPEEGKVAGVCTGLADYLDVDVTLVRLAWVILSIVPGFLIGGVVAYAAAWVLMPVAGLLERRAPRRAHLTRSERNRQVGGVCGGLAEYFGVDATIVRVVVVVLAIYPGAVIGGVIAYLIAWFIMPAAQGSLPAAPAMNA